MNEKLHISIPIIVEGKYDKIKLASIVDGQILTTDGFGIFKSEEKKLLFRRLAAPNGLIVLTDSDGAGLVIRNYFKQILPKEKLIHLYIPQIEGKEKRKLHPGKAGLLGVEGMDVACLRQLLIPFADQNAPLQKKSVTKQDFYADGLSGRDDSSVKRKALCKKMDLPDNLSANGLLEAINLLYDYTQYKNFLSTEADQND